MRKLSERHAEWIIVRPIGLLLPPSSFFSEVVFSGIILLIPVSLLRQTGLPPAAGISGDFPPAFARLKQVFGSLFGGKVLHVSASSVLSLLASGQSVESNWV
ncbi:hypothetical protein PIB30_057304 [Stylosanthes scabra]|uniref:Uncharacterized protein n=1 Tax=Stylosanthes scabra TaxID=79078 RepID=A0ABU6XJZ4_9FABA|nr:hypothetical protein [Stylosanthes scabra]